MGDDHAFIATRLEEEYCPPLDPALVRALLSDYTLNKPDDLSVAQAILDDLRESAIIEEATSLQDPEVRGTSPVFENALREETSAASSKETDLTSVESGLTNLSLDHDASLVNDFADVDDETKVQILFEIFNGEVKAFQIRSILTKCNGNVNRTIDELLNHGYINGERPAGSVTNAIDAFSEDNLHRRIKTQKRKFRHNRTSLSGDSDFSSASSAASTPTMSNKWVSSDEDVTFIASRVNIPASTIKSLYHKNGASRAKTIRALLSLPVPKTIDVPSYDPILVVNAEDLKVDFPNLTRTQCITLLQLTHPYTAPAHELARSLSAINTPTIDGIEIIPHYTQPTDLLATPSTTTPSHLLPTNPYPTDPIHTATTLTHLQTQAATLHRRAKSDRHLSGAASYYATAARSLAAARLTHRATEMDALAARQTRVDEVDLHGVDAVNARRIALARVEDWWRTARGEDGRVRGAGYRIVVGAGTHSAGGKAVLGPAVRKVLREGGWRVEDEGAVVVVKGRVRR